MKKRLLSWLLILCMIIVVFPAVATQADAADVIASGGHGSPYWKVTSDGVLTLSGTGGMEGSSTGDYPWLDYKSQITEIVVTKGVTSIADQAFIGMKKVTSVTLGSTVKSIGEEAFRNCDGLTTITIPASVQNIEMGAFFLCDNLETVKFKSGSALNTIGGSAFQDTGLKSIEIPDSVEIIEDYAFMNCASLTSLSLGDNVASIGESAFEGCGMTGLEIPASVEEIDWYAFRSCKKLTKLETSAEVNYEEEFTYCPIAELVVRAPVTSVENFDNCTTLTSVTLADTVVTIEGSAFRGCTALAEINWPNQLKEIGSEAFNNTGLTEVVLPDSVTSVDTGAFRYNSNLRTVTLGKNTELIGGCVFENCTGLVQVDLANTDTIPLETFIGCTALEKVEMSEVELVRYSAFQNCTSLTQVTFPATLQEMEHSVFSGCTNLKLVEFLGDAPVFDNSTFSGATVIGSFPAGNETWTEDVRQNYGGNVTWSGCGAEGHTYGDGVVTAPTCTEQGYTSYVCTACGISEKADYTDALGHDLADLVCTRCGYGDVEAPAVMISNVASTGKIRLTWAKVDGAVKYEIYRASSANGPFSLKYSTSGTGYTNTGAKTGQTFWYYVAAISETGKTVASSVVSRTCTLPQPEVKIGNVASTGKIRLKWEAVEGAVKYEVYRASSKNGEYTLKYTTTGTGYTNTGAKAGQSFYYKVKAIAENPDASSALSAAKGRVCDLPRPAIRVGNDPATGKVVLAWDAVNGAVKYQVLRSTTGNSYQYLESTTDTRYVDTTAEAGVKYYYKVYALAQNSNANSANSSAKARVCDLPQPETTVTLNAKGKPVVKWEAIPGAVNYQIYRSTSLNGTYKRIYTASKTQFINSGAASDVTYYYKVRAVHSNTSANSALSEGKCAGTTLEAPQVSITLNAKGKPRLTWNKVDGAVKYQVYRATSPNGTYSLKYTTTGTGYANTGAAAGTTYYYKVRAVSDGTYSDSAYSEMVFINCSTVGISDCVAANEVIDRINEWREYAELPALEWYDEGLDAAKIRAAELEVLPSDTERPDGSSPEDLWEDYGVTIELCLVTQPGTSGEDLVDAMMLDEDLEDFGIVCLLDIWSGAVAARNGDYWIIMFVE